FILITILMAFISSAGAADIEVLYNDLRKSEQRDFGFVVETCHMSINSLAAMVEAAREDSLGDLKYFFTMGESILTEENMVDRKGIGKHVDRLINSPGYYLGLIGCFPNSETKRHQYTMSLLLLDAFGKAATISILTV